MSPAAAIVVVLIIIGAYYVYARQGASSAALPYVPPPASTPVSTPVSTPTSLAPVNKPPVSKAPVVDMPTEIEYSGDGFGNGSSLVFSIQVPTQGPCTNLCKASPGECDFVEYNSANTTCAGYKLPARAGMSTLVKTPSGYFVYPETDVAHASQYGAKLSTDASCSAFCDASTGCVAVNTLTAGQNYCAGYAMTDSPTWSTTWVKPMASS